MGEIMDIQRLANTINQYSAKYRENETEAARQISLELGGKVEDLGSKFREIIGTKSIPVVQYDQLIKGVALIEKNISVLSFEERPWYMKIAEKIFTRFATERLNREKSAQQELSKLRIGLEGEKFKKGLEAIQLQINGGGELLNEGDAAAVKMFLTKKLVPYATNIIRVSSDSSLTSDQKLEEMMEINKNIQQQLLKSTERRDGSEQLKETVVNSNLNMALLLSVHTSLSSKELGRFFDWIEAEKDKISALKPGETVSGSEKLAGGDVNYEGFFVSWLTAVENIVWLQQGG
jgi:hypothetical protein